MAINEKILSKMNELTQGDKTMKKFLHEVLINEESKGYGKADRLAKLIEQYAKEFETDEN